jgi:hypothetical protein
MENTSLKEWLNDLSNRKIKFICQESYCREDNSSLDRISMIDNNSMKFVFLCRSCGNVFSIEISKSTIETEYRIFKESNEIDFSSVKWFVLLIYGMKNNKINGISLCEEIFQEIVSSHLESKIRGIGLWNFFVQNVKRKFLVK